MNPLTGYRDHRIDPKDRVVIPARFADRIRAKSQGRLFLVPSLHTPCLQAHPADFFFSLAKDEVPDPIAVDEPQRRNFFQRAEEVELKGPGRITLPKRFLPYFPVRVVRVAGFNRYLELWDPDTWDEEMAKTAGPLPLPKPRGPGS
ncbi:MAG: division/cell wall cluster transcriptional repressor MraZ [Planctomycetota bacterium]|jgi:DNA-binding transcriptional regulator/RsmH inhibitor MraZ